MDNRKEKKEKRRETFKACQAKKAEKTKNKEDSNPPLSVAHPLPPPYSYQQGQGYYEGHDNWN